jgi:hypothetical protein
MPKVQWVFVFALFAAVPAAAQTAIPDLRGNWKGESESIVLGAGNPHHPATPTDEPQLRSVSFSLNIDKQDGRRFSGIFSSTRSSEKVIGVISRSGAIFVADDEGYTRGTMLAPNRMEWCYLHVSTAARVASCVELTRQ